jgi:hypothetical protein
VAFGTRAVFKDEVGKIFVHAAVGTRRDLLLGKPLDIFRKRDLQATHADTSTSVL